MGALDFLSAADVMLDVNAKNKGDLLEILAAQAAARVGGGRPRDTRRLECAGGTRCHSSR